MAVVLWMLIALAAIFGVLFSAVRMAQRQLPPLTLPPGERMPTTPLQRLARRTLLLVGFLTLAAAAIVIWFGVAAWWENDAVRLSFTGVLMAGLAVFTVYISLVWRLMARDDGSLDERDRAILASAPAGQAPAMLVTFAAWMIGLTETYQQTHLVPSPFLYLIFWSLLMVSVLGLLAGVLLGYRRR